VSILGALLCSAPKMSSFTGKTPVAKHEKLLLIDTMNKKHPPPASHSASLFTWKAPGAGRENRF